MLYRLGVGVGLSPHNEAGVLRVLIEPLLGVLHAVDDLLQKHVYFLGETAARLGIQTIRNGQFLLVGEEQFDLAEHGVQHVLLDVAPLGEQSGHVQLARGVVDQRVVYFALESYSRGVLRELARELHYEFEFGLFVEALPHQDDAVPD